MLTNKLFSAWKTKLVTTPSAIHQHKISLARKLNGQVG